VTAIILDTLSMTIEHERIRLPRSIERRLAG
jgi:hypothetical protein